MLRSRKLKFAGPNVCAPNKGFDCGRSRLYPHGPGSGGGCIAARGDDISMVALAIAIVGVEQWYCTLAVGSWW